MAGLVAVVETVAMPGCSHRGGARGFGGANAAAATAAVFHHHGLAQFAPQGLGNHAGNQVGGAACRKRNQQADGLVGPGGLGLAALAAGRGYPRARAVRRITEGWFSLVIRCAPFWKAGAVFSHEGA